MATLSSKPYYSISVVLKKTERRGGSAWYPSKEHREERKELQKRLRKFNTNFKTRARCEAAIATLIKEGVAEEGQLEVDELWSLYF